MIDLNLEDELEGERIALEREGAKAHTLGVVATDYVRAIHPDHGEPVVFVPGEALPHWAAAGMRQ